MWSWVSMCTGVTGGQSFKCPPVRPKVYGTCPPNVPLSVRLVPPADIERVDVADLGLVQ